MEIVKLEELYKLYSKCIELVGDSPEQSGIKICDDFLNTVENLSYTDLIEFLSYQSVRENISLIDKDTSNKDIIVDAISFIPENRIIDLIDLKNQIIKLCDRFGIEVLKSYYDSCQNAFIYRWIYRVDVLQETESEISTR